MIASIRGWLRKRRLLSNKDVAVSFNSFPIQCFPLASFFLTCWPIQKDYCRPFFSSLTRPSIGTSFPSPYEERTRATKKKEVILSCVVCVHDWLLETKTRKKKKQKKKRTTNGPAERIKLIFPFSGRSHFLLIDDPRTRSRFKEEALDSGKKVVNVCCFFLLSVREGRKRKTKKKKMREREGKWGRKKKKAPQGFRLYPCGDSCLNLILTRLLAAYSRLTKLNNHYRSAILRISFLASNHPNANRFQSPPPPAFAFLFFVTAKKKKNENLSALLQSNL